MPVALQAELRQLTVACDCLTPNLLDLMQLIFDTVLLVASGQAGSLKRGNKQDLAGLYGNIQGITVLDDSLHCFSCLS